MCWAIKLARSRIFRLSTGNIHRFVKVARVKLVMVDIKHKKTVFEG